MLERQSKIAISRQARLRELMQKCRGIENEKVTLLLAAAITKHPHKRWQTCKALVDLYAYVVFLEEVDAEPSISNENLLPVLRNSSTLAFPDSVIQDYVSRYKQQTLYKGLSNSPELTCVEVILREESAMSINFMPLSTHLPEISEQRLANI